MSQENVEIVRRFLEVVQRVYDAYFQRPYSLEDRLKAGEVPPEGVEVMRNLHPNIRVEVGHDRHHLPRVRGNVPRRRSAP